MNKIVIVSDGKEEKGGLAALLRVIFPECGVCIVSRHDFDLSPHGMDDDQGEDRVSRFDWK